jgi:hypothetical protein
MSTFTREPGRPTLLNPEIEEKLVEATKMGTPMGVAAEFCGISKRTFEDWMRRGREEQAARDAEEPPNEVEQKYLDLYLAITQARSHATVTSASLIRRAAVGGQVTERTTRKYRDATGEIVEEVTEKRSTGDWRAAAFWLERQNRTDFGKETKQVTEVTGGVDVNVNLGELAARVTENIAELTATGYDGGEVKQIGGSDREATAGPDVVDAEVVPD